MLEVITIVGFILAIIIAIVFSVVIARHQKSNQLRYKIIDTAVLTIFLVPVLARILGLFFHGPELVGTSWSLLPVIEEQGILVWFGEWPWRFLKITDGYFLFAEGLTAVFLARVLVNIGHGRSNKQSIRFSYNRLSTISSLLSLVPLALILIINQHQPDLFSLNIGFVWLISIGIGIFLSLIIVKMTWQINLLVIIAQLFTIFVFTRENQAFEGFAPTSIVIVYIIMSIFSFLLLLANLTAGAENTPKRINDNTI